MKNMVLLSVWVVFSISNVMSQTFTEITSDGWNMGIATSKPAISDIDGDGLLDLLIGEWAGRITHFEQDAINSTTFSFITNNFSNITTDRYAAPSIVDLDNDGRLDLIIGVNEGTLVHYEQNTAGSETFFLVTESFNDIKLSFNATPTFTDLDNDGLFDLLVGDGDGYIHHYVQDAVDARLFSVVTDTFNHINNGRFVAQTVMDIDGDGLLDLFTSGKNNRIAHYTQDTVNSTNFTEANTSFNDIKLMHVAPVFTDLDGDSRFDMLIGEITGAIHYYRQETQNSMEFAQISSDFCTTKRIAISLNAHPCVSDIDGDGLLDLLIGGYPNETLFRFVQEAAGSNAFHLVSSEFSGIHIAGDFLHPAITDFNGNDLLDLVVGENSGHLHYYEQNSAGSLDFTWITDTLSGIRVSNNAAPEFTDLDADGRLDLLIGQHNGTLTHYEQEAVNSTNFTLITESFNDIDLFMMTVPTFTDLDSDGLIDMLVGTYSGTVHHYEQEAANSHSFSQITDNFLDFLGWYVCPCFADINGDGFDDLLIGDYDGGIHFYRRDDGTSVEAGRAGTDMVRNFQLYQNYPNPFNPETCIRFDITEESHVKLHVFDINGKRVSILADNEFSAGSHRLIFNGSGLPSGIYFYKFETNTIQEVREMIFVK